VLYAALRERILDGTYGPGFRVVIDVIAEEFGVSALPVREAIRRLEAEGLVIYRANAGAQVTPADPESFGENMAVLAVLEGYATALAAPHIERSDLEALTNLTDAMGAAMEQMDSLAFAERNHEFHAVIHKRCPNSALEGMVRDVDRRLNAIRRTVFVHIPYRGAQSIAEHRELIRLIESGASGTRIERAARDHKLRTLASFQAWQRDRGRAGGSAAASQVAMSSGAD
jgi:DNA-binding GntR family transcriptional regulator